MKKWILSAAAAGALAVGGAASAQDLAAVLGSIITGAPYGTIYYDAYGRQQVMIDQNGRQVLVPPTAVRDGSGYVGSRTVVVPAVPYGTYAYNNRYIYQNQSRSWDRDGDGISNRRDRYPYDPRYR